MTALAGVIGSHDAAVLHRECQSVLAAQSLYGSGRPSIVDAHGAAFGILPAGAASSRAGPSQALADGRWLIAADARLDNRDELLASLGIASGPGPVSDGHILLAAWQRWEEGCPDRLVGAFAFALYDTERRELILARDVTGERPLCFAENQGRLVFASMPSGVVAGTSFALDLEAMATWLAAPPLAHGRTLFAGVERVMPRELVRWGPTGISRRTYWRPDTSIEPRSHADLVDGFRHHLDTAVNSHMAGSAEVVATQLSSGFDSSAVTGTAARLAGADQRLIAFTSAPLPGLPHVLPRNRIADESPYAAMTAAMHGINHQVVRDSTPLLDQLAGHVAYYQEPVGNLFNAGWWNAILAEAARAGATSLLIGQMGNFTISYGGVAVLRHWIAAGQPVRWLRQARAIVAATPIRWRGALFNSFGPWLPQAVSAGLYRRFWGMPQGGQFDFVRPEVLERVQGTRGDGGQFQLTSDIHADQLRLIRRSDPGMTRKGALARHAIDQRDPTADRRLIEYCLRLPAEALLYDGTIRPVARAAVADRVPRAVLDLPVRGYQAADWFARLRRDDVRAAIEEIAASRSAGELIDLARLKAAVEQWPVEGLSFNGLEAFGRKLTNALAVGAFVAEAERYPDRLGRRP